ncbi:hypothetical protein ACJIZ3_002919 [Penstemon smallii]|uniref:Chaperone DnaJ C-terminal domain-containing protein n=1 Tax=Penstemon smallii TaxID=265156 RepID=A0ABD3U9A8_9LAMI
MANHSRSHSHGHELFHILRFGNICRTCKSFVSNCYPPNNSSFSNRIDHHKTCPTSIQQDIIKSPTYRELDEENANEMHVSRCMRRYSSRGSSKRRNCDEMSPTMSRSKSLSRNASLDPSPLSRSTSKRIQNTATMSRRNSLDPHSLSRCTSRKGSTPIMYSNSNGLIKPPPMEQQLDCTLEELCFGCTKKIKIARDAITENGLVIKEDEVLTIKVKPGWSNGTKITFEGMGNETPGMDPADVIFVVSEKRHPLFIREGDDDLELGVEIPLVEALTGCTLSVPLLGGQPMSLTIDDIIYPGFQKIVTGQGMPKQNEPGVRGNLIITFLVEFPEELTDEQRLDVVNILQNNC